MWRLSWVASVVWSRVTAWPEWVRVMIMVAIGLALVVGMFAVYLRVGGDPLPRVN